MTTDDNFASVRPFGFRAPRASSNFSFLVEVTSSGKQLQAVCTDISEDGLAADMAEPLEPKTNLIIRMLLPGGTVPVQIPGSVEYSQGRRCGLTFLYSSPEDREQVRIFVQSIS